MNGYATAAAIIAAVFFAAAFVCVMPGSDADVTYSVEGMVQDSGGNGIEGVRVTISSHPDTTAADGSFKITDLESVSAEELMALAREEGVQLSDEELESVSGGAWNCGDCTDHVCQVVCSSASKIVRPDLARKLM